jgi:Bifunctional DNA primase/polymerase, N-terminal/Primase C terminal 2 (PriCT-2)
MKNNPHRASDSATGAEVVGQFQQTPYTTSCPSQQFDQSLVASALHYAKCGWKVFPLHSIGPDGKCSCGRADCSSPGKHPLTRHGFKDATADPCTIEGWWTRWPGANIGIATGKASGGLAVLDVDGREGMAELQALTEKQGTLPQTLVSQTGNGFHIFFQGNGIKSSANGNLHVRADGGYVVASPSKHVTGRLYQFIKAHPIAPLPAWLKEWMQGGAARTVHPGSASSVFGENVPKYLQSLPRDLETVRTALRNLSGSTWSEHEEARIHSALRSIPADNYESWYKIGMILQGLQWIRSDGSDVGLEIWDEWSQICLAVC